MDVVDSKAVKRSPLAQVLVPPAKGVLWCINRFIRLVSHDATFFDNARYPWIQEVEADYPGIREECLRIVSDLNQVPNLEELADSGSRHLASGGDWKAVLLMIFGQPIEKNTDRCPQTYAALQKIPGVQSALFSILAPGVHLPRHTGPFAGVLRYHLGVLVPDDAGCRISVDDEIRQWGNGASLVFDDTHPHEVWNETDQLRVVLFVDVLRPMPAPLQWGVRTLFALARVSPLGKTFIANANRAAAGH